MSGSFKRAVSQLIKTIPMAGGSTFRTDHNVIALDESFLANGAPVIFKIHHDFQPPGLHDQNKPEIYQIGNDKKTY